MPETPNHGYNVPNEGAQDWHEPLNKNFRQYDTDIEIRDEYANRDQYEPKEGAKFFDVKTGYVLLGNGSDWEPLGSTGMDPIFSTSQVNDTLRVGKVIRCLGRVVARNIRADSNFTVSGDEGESSTLIYGSVSGKATSDNHVALIENTADGDSDDVLALKMNEDPPGNGNNYISFKDTNDDSMGAIEGDGEGGVTMAGPGNDYAEWLPRADIGESLDAGDIVGVHAGEVDLRTEGADRVLVVSTQPIVTGNDPGPEAAAREGYEKIAFVGQAPAKVQGPAEPGDVVVPSGENDGTGRAITTGAYAPADGPILGQAWESTAAEGVTKVTVAVGVGGSEALQATIERKDERIEALEARLEALEERTATLEANGDIPASADD